MIYSERKTAAHVHGGETLPLNIHYKFDVPKFGHINEFKDLKSQDISTIDVTVDLFANLGAVIIMEFKTAN